MFNNYILVKIALNSNYSFGIDIILNSFNNKICNLTLFMSKEFPTNDELLFPEKGITGNVLTESKDIVDYERATEKARNGGVGILSVKRNPDGQALEVSIVICDKNGDLIEAHYDKNIEPDSYSFLSLTDEDKVMNWNKKMIRRETEAAMKKIVAGIFMPRGE